MLLDRHYGNKFVDGFNLTNIGNNNLFSHQGVIPLYKEIFFFSSVQYSLTLTHVPVILHIDGHIAKYPVSLLGVGGLDL